MGAGVSPASGMGGRDGSSSPKDGGGGKVGASSSSLESSRLSSAGASKVGGGGKSGREGAESSASETGGRAGSSSPKDGGGGKLGASSSSVFSSGSASAMEGVSSAKEGGGRGDSSSFSSSTTGSGKGAGDSALDAPLPYFWSYPPVATLRTCTTLTPVSREMAALFGLGSASISLILSKVSWFMETVCLLPVGEVEASLFLKAAVVKGVNALMRSLVFLREVPSSLFTKLCRSERKAEFFSLDSLLATSAFARS